MTQALEGKHAVVVGTSNPAGRAIAVALAEAGADVAIASATLDGDEVMAAKRIAREVEKLGRRSLSHAWDVTLPTNVQVSLRQVVKDLGPLDILVYNADLPFEKPIEKTTDSEFARVQAVNLHGAYYAARSFLRELADQPGVLVFLTSPLAETGSPDASAYLTAKAGLMGLVRALAAETGARPVSVHALPYDPTDTDPAALERLAAGAVDLAPARPAGA